MEDFQGVSMSLRIIENRKIKSNQRYLNNFLERFLDIPKNFKIDCEAVNISEHFSSNTTVTIRHRKPARESIYYAEAFKERDEEFYFFGLARDNVIATSNYLSQESHIVPSLVATLHLEDSSKSNIVFASDSKEYNNVILLRIDCSELNDIELDVLKNKNKITKLTEGKGFINFGAIGDFNTLRNIRNFISNVKFENQNSPYVKIVEVSIPDNYSSIKPDSNILKDRFYNFNGISPSDVDSEDVIDLNETADDVVSDGNAMPSESSVGGSAGVVEFEVLAEKESVIEFETSNDGGFVDSSSGSYKKYHFDDTDLYIEMSIGIREFFENMRIFDIFAETYDVCDLDYIEVLDMGDGLLSITAIFLIGAEENIEIIKEYFNINHFVEAG